MSTRWQNADAPRGDDYDARWARLAASGTSVHGEADFVDGLLDEIGGTSVLDAGCGTGRVAVELGRRGRSVIGVDADPRMLDTARAKAEDIPWLLADLAALDAHVDQLFDVVLLAGNVMIFLDRGSEARVLGQVALRLAPDGRLVAGFSIRTHRLQLDAYDRLAEAAGLRLESRWATWDRQPFSHGDYAVSVHRRAAVAGSSA